MYAILALLWEHRLKLSLLVSVISIGLATWQFASITEREFAAVAVPAQQVAIAEQHFKANPAAACDEYTAALTAYDRQATKSQIAIGQAGVELIAHVESEQFVHAASEAH